MASLQIFPIQMNTGNAKATIMPLIDLGLYILDGTTDLLFSYDLYKRCHHFFAILVFAFVLLPGIAIMIFDTQQPWYMRLSMPILKPFLTIWVLLKQTISTEVEGK